MASDFHSYNNTLLGDTVKELIRAEIKVTEDGRYVICAAASRSSHGAEYAFGYFYNSEGIAFSGERLEMVKGGIKGSGELLRVEALDNLLACLVSQTQAYNMRLIADSVRREPEFDDGLKINADDAKRMTDDGLKMTFDALKNEMHGRSFLKDDEIIYDGSAIAAKSKSLRAMVSKWYDDNNHSISMETRRKVLTFLDDARFLEEI